MIRSHVLKGINAATKPSITPTEEDVAALVRKVERAAPSNLENFAYVVGRNWAIDKKRRAIAKEARLAEEAERHLIENAQRQHFVKVREEAKRLIAKLSRTATPTQHTQLQLVWWKVFEALSHDDVAKLLPGTQRDARVKNFQRGRDVLIKHGSADLKAYLSHRISPAGGITASPLPA